MATPKFEIYPSGTQYRWRLKDGNGEIIASGEPLRDTRERTARRRERQGDRARRRHRGHLTPVSEETLYDRDGEPVAYITEDATIYLWNGDAIAYVDNDRVYGWNGHHLGWFTNGVVSDLRGHRVGSVRSRCNVMTRVAPMKSMKRMRGMRSMREMARMRPMLSQSRSNATLRSFLHAGHH